MIDIIDKLGLLKTLVIITVLSVAGSVTIAALTLFTARALGQPTNAYIAYSLSILAPLVITPLMSWWLIRLLLKIHHLEENMRKLATYDALTEVLNRRAFFEQTLSLVNLGKREKSVCSVFVIDLDHFKKINDAYGHEAGDEVLKRFAAILMNSLRRSDLIGRLGGEEFAVFLPKAGHDEANLLAERIHLAISKNEVAYENQQIKYTVSIGVVTRFLTEDNSIKELLRASDKALYQAKENGRNQTFVISEGA
ncbi:MAG: GGDEF domain-containing protein [Pseudomonadota bacterium]